MKEVKKGLFFSIIGREISVVKKLPRQIFWGLKHKALRSWLEADRTKEKANYSVQSVDRNLGVWRMERTADLERTTGKKLLPSR